MADPRDLNGDGVIDDDELIAAIKRKNAVETKVEDEIEAEATALTDEELIKKASEFQSRQKQAAGEPEDLTMMDRLRLVGQGLSFNWSDEAIAGIKALSPNVTYEDALSQEREFNNCLLYTSPSPRD